MSTTVPIAITLVVTAASVLCVPSSSAVLIFHVTKQPFCILANVCVSFGVGEALVVAFTLISGFNNDSNVSPSCRMKSSISTIGGGAIILVMEGDGDDAVGTILGSPTAPTFVL